MANGDRGVDHFMGRVVALDAKVDEHDAKIEELERRQAQVDSLSRSVDQLAAQVRKLGLAVGIAKALPLPEEWEEITQIRRPELHSLRVRAKAGPPMAAAAVILTWIVREILGALGDGRLRLPWH
jgi:hypothetical protein